MTDIVKRLLLGAVNGVLIPCDDLVEAAELIEQCRADHESDKQTNDEQRVELNQCRAALAMRNSDVQALQIALAEAADRLAARGHNFGAREARQAINTLPEWYCDHGRSGGCSCASSCKGYGAVTSQNYRTTTNGDQNA